MARAFSKPAGGDASLLKRMEPPIGQPGEPEQVAAAVAFLAGPSARYITGAALPVDGGQVAG
jgi:NAD(P)-dependent dehydrogenase (short-subunit alcohol dehydrogenase family)